MPGQYRHQAEDQRQFAVRRPSVIEPHRERIGRLGLCDLGIILPVVGTSLVAQQRPGEQHVVGEDRLSVREPRPRIEMERDIAPGIVGLNAACQQAIKRERLVITARHQALDHEAPDLLHGEAPDDQGVEAVEGSKQTLHQAAAFRRIGICIGHVGEIGRQGRLAVHGDGVLAGGPTGIDRKPDTDDGTGKDANTPAPGTAPYGALI